MEIALVQPEIPPNTGNIARLCVCTGSGLAIIGKPSFSMNEAAVRRAGLDYWHLLKLEQFADWTSFVGARKGRRLFALTRFASRPYCEERFRTDDVLVFGSESAGLPAEITRGLAEHSPESLLRIPVGPDCRSLNLANAAAIVLYEALRQTGFPGLVIEAPKAR
ncbi:MAG: tRNA (cytidine(34)-2'-O)-methyltransferase [Spirochaetales bacterium]|nr:tRNA (cytidine(34)-2'-O)-methyltransferase [Leptospiraceae bacterium]MCP5483154.1 tRNA (cytidine(34)-2'-O)-methyltransferase [Spirochaetales bacterium]MCP5484594.1 tRNA (cytidine(34)-2'-O)-methyltransferase [Spirochaetales bacterium]